MNDKTRLRLIKIGYLVSVAFSLCMVLTFYYAFFVGGGELLIKLNAYGEMFIEAFVYIPIGLFLILMGYWLVLTVSTE